MMNHHFMSLYVFNFWVLFQNHCKSEQHQQLTMSDEGRVWKFRAPPRIGPNESFKLCPNFQLEGRCNLAIQCADAHSTEELKEWKERLEYRQKKANKALKMFKSFNDILTEKLSSGGGNVNKILTGDLHSVKCTLKEKANVTLTSKSSEFKWTFSLKALDSEKSLHCISLLSENGLESNFNISKVQEIIHTDDSTEKLKSYYPSSTEFNVQDGQELANLKKQKDYKIEITFKATVYGTFKQSVIFSFGSEPYLRKDVSVDVKLALDDEESKLEELQDILVAQGERWSGTNCQIRDFNPPLLIVPPEDTFLYQSYPMPQPVSFKPSKAVIEHSLTKMNYKQRMHDLLYIEEMAQFEQISHFNVKVTLKIINKYLLSPTSTNSSTAKYARPGELFGSLSLRGNLSEDTTAGRLILTNCTSLLLKSESNQNKAYVTGIEDSGKANLYLRLSANLVTDFKLKDEDTFKVEVQFQLNRLPMCEMHLAIDKLHDLSLVYPDTNRQVKIPWTPLKYWNNDEELTQSRLNAKQREAVLAFTSPAEVPLPPILLIGPYGTGKTFTLAQSMKMLLRQEGTKILVCTHSNSAADLYIRDYLDPFITTNTSVKLLRIYYTNRWVQTVHTTVQKYCLIENNGFKYPAKEDIRRCDIVVTTLGTSRYLSTIGLKIGTFSHIFIDEAAQALECEAIMPLALALPFRTRVVLAGDHMQLSPEVFSTFAKEKKFNKSLLERLYDLYPPNYPCKILLCENYRSHEAIIGYTSELFYEQKLLASGKQTKHDTWHPLTVFTARGEDVQDTNSTSFYNNAEVYEVVERVHELQKSWPKSWGERHEYSIGIVTPYYDQVQRIRSELKKRRLFGVSVERVLNVQGKQFRVIFLSTVRTRRTCVQHSEDEDTDFGFLSNAKLLNTAITRAQSLVAVVGDPVALCSIGKCRRLWERFVDISRKNNSLFGTTWAALRVMLDHCELRKGYVLNPLAPEFVPRATRNLHYQKEAYLNQLINAARTESSLNNQRPSHQNHQPQAHHGTPPPWMHPYYNIHPLNRPIPPQLLNFLPPPWPPLPYGMVPPVTVAPPLHPSMFRIYGPDRQGALDHQAARLQGPLPIIPRSPPKSLPRPLAMHPNFNQSPAKRVGNSQKQQVNMYATPTVQPHLQRPTGPRMNQAGGTSRQATAMSATAAPSVSDKSYTFLKDGVHFPPVPAIPPPAFAPVSAANSELQKMKKNASSSQVSSNPKALEHKLEPALDVLPTDIELTMFLKSPQLQHAWLLKLQNEGEDKAKTFKEVIFFMQSNPDQIPEMREKLLANKEKDNHRNSISATRKVDLQEPVASSWLEQPSKSPASGNILMPSASSADAFYTFANAASRTNQIHEEFEDFKALTEDPVINEVLKSDNASSDGGDNCHWGSVSSLLHHRSTESLSSSPSIPLYKRRAGFNNEMKLEENSLFPEPERLDPFWSSTELGTRSSTMPSSSLSTIWSTNGASIVNQQKNNQHKESSGLDQQKQTYANVLRHNQESPSTSDPLQKIRQLGTRGSQELYFESNSTTDNENQESNLNRHLFSPFFD